LLRRFNRGFNRERFRRPRVFADRSAARVVLAFNAFAGLVGLLSAIELATGFGSGGIFVSAVNGDLETDLLTPPRLVNSGPFASGLPGKDSAGPMGLGTSCGRDVFDSLLGSVPFGDTARRTSPERLKLHD
jgi:hypothetical protein